MDLALKIALISGVPPTLAVVVSMVVGIIGRKKADQKADIIIVQTNSHMTTMQRELSTAVKEVAAARAEVSGLRELVASITGATRAAPSSEVTSTAEVLDKIEGNTAATALNTESPKT